MRVIIFSDMEGATAIVTREQCDSTHPIYAEARRLYTEDVNAAVRGARAAGATTIHIKEFHGNYEPYNVHHLIPELLDPDCEAWAHVTAPVEQIMKQPYDACVLVGFHARSLTPDGVLSHTITGAWRRVWLDGVEIGETGIVAGLVGFYGAPVAAVCGDTAVCREARELLGEGVTTVAVKEGVNRTGALIIPPARSRKMIEAGVQAGLQKLGQLKPYATARPCRLRIEATSVEVAGQLAGLKGAILEDPFHVTLEGKDYIEVINHLFGLS